MSPSPTLDLIEKYAAEKASNALLQIENREMKERIVMLQGDLKRSEASRKKKHHKPAGERQGPRILQLVCADGKIIPNR